jgi:hypothetical protein
MDLSFNNTIIFLIVIIISLYLFFNYDIYIIKKGSNLLNKIIVEKKIINDLQPFSNEKINKTENFKNTNNKNNKINTINKNNNVMNNTIKILKKIKYDKISKQNKYDIVLKLKNIYKNSNNIKEFQNKIEKIKKNFPYNTKYFDLVSKIIIKLDNEITKSTKTKQKKVSFSDNNKVIIVDNKEKQYFNEPCEISENYSKI